MDEHWASVWGKTYKDEVVVHVGRGMKGARISLVSTNPLGPHLHAYVEQFGSLRGEGGGFGAVFENVPAGEYWVVGMHLGHCIIEAGVDAKLLPGDIPDNIVLLDPGYQDSHLRKAISAACNNLKKLTGVSWGMKYAALLYTRRQFAPEMSAAEKILERRGKNHLAGLTTEQEKILGIISQTVVENMTELGLCRAIDFYRLLSLLYKGRKDSAKILEMLHPNQGNSVE